MCLEISTLVAEKTMMLAQGLSDLEGLGLYRGKTGALLALHAAKTTLPNSSLKLVEKLMGQLQDDIADNVDTADYTFSNGVFGIAWGIGTLFERQYLSEDENSVMNTFDDELYKLVIARKLTTFDLETGIMGRVIYYLHRVTDDLKSSSKYRYLLNYELLMLLTDDFIIENEKILQQVSEDTAHSRDRLFSYGGYYSNIFTLLTIQVKKRIHAEVAERQQIKFIRLFLNFLESLIDQPGAAFQNETAYWNTIAILNCLLWSADQSPTISQRLRKGKTLLERFFDDGFPASLESKRFVLKLFFLHLCRDSIAQGQLNRHILAHDWHYDNWGLAGFSGTVYALSLFSARTIRFEDFLFLSFSTY